LKCCCLQVDCPSCYGARLAFHGGSAGQAVPVLPEPMSVHLSQAKPWRCSVRCCTQPPLSVRQGRWGSILLSMCFSQALAVSHAQVCFHGGSVGQVQPLGEEGSVPLPTYMCLSQPSAVRHVVVCSGDSVDRLGPVLRPSLEPSLGGMTCIGMLEQGGVALLVWIMKHSSQCYISHIVLCYTM
jgi:hypothetical protein